MAKNTLKYRDTLYAKLGSGSLHLAMSFLPDSLEPNTLSAEVETESRALLDFNLDDPVTVYHREEQMGIFYLQSVTQIAPNKYALYATSAVGLLIRRCHRGGLYTGQTVAEVLPEIFGPVPYSIKSNLEGIKLYGWLPYVKPPDASARDNLCKILFNIGAIVKTDLDGVIRIEPLWDGIASSIPRGRMGLAASAVRDGKVTAVSVTEHQYVAGTDEEDLFEGTTQSGDEISFDAPMHSLTATGFSILEHGANYAVLSAGSGTLTGKSYIHNTRVVTKTVNNSQIENVQDYSDQTLVSLVSSVSVVERLAAYYRCFESIDAPVVYRGEAPGDRILTYHPYDMVSVPACLESADINLSNVLKADEKLLVGYIPPKAAAGYYDASEVITQEGDWPVPDGVTSLRVVIIGGGQGGWSGLPGNTTENATIVNETTELTGRTSYVTGYPSVAGGAGGSGGEGGDGGRVYIISLDVTPGQTFHISIGQGGPGGAPGEDSSQGSDGTDTTFGGYSSASGASTPGGYTDETTGTVYGAMGQSGIPGGAGNGQVYTPGEGWGDVQNGPSVTFGGKTWSPGENKNKDSIADEAGSWNAGKGYFEATADGGFGGGAAVGANGNPGYAASDGSVYASKTGASARGARGGKGADASPPPAQIQIGHGGLGGNGGGGAGSGGTSLIENSVSTSLSGGSMNPSRPEKSPGGAGSAGGKGGPGGVLLFYAKPKPDTSGQLKDKNGLSILDRLGRRIIV